MKPLLNRKHNLIISLAMIIASVFFYFYLDAVEPSKRVRFWRGFSSGAFFPSFFYFIFVLFFMKKTGDKHAAN